jgi:hypothetical protein
MKAEKPVKEQELAKLKVELTVQEWEAVLSVVDQSTAPHLQVKSVSTELVKQLQPQIKTEDAK